MEEINRLARIRRLEGMSAEQEKKFKKLKQTLKKTQGIIQEKKFGLSSGVELNLEVEATGQEFRSIVLRLGSKLDEGQKLETRKIPALSSTLSIVDLNTKDRIRSRNKRFQSISSKQGSGTNFG